MESACAVVNHVLEYMPEQLMEAQTKLETVEHQLETAKVEVTKPFAQEAELVEKTVGTGQDKGIRQYADVPAERVSLKVMKAKVAGGDTEKPMPLKAKAKEKEETL